MFKKMSLLTIVLTFSLLFGSFAMADVVNGDFIRKSPLNEEENSSYEWTWLNDEHCVQFTTKDDKLKREHIERFQSTPSLRKATLDLEVSARYTFISIHTFLAEGDHGLG